LPLLEILVSLKSHIFLKINCLLAISQDISGKIVDIPNNLTIKVYCKFGVLPDLGNSAAVGTNPNSLALKSSWFSAKLILRESKYYAKKYLFLRDRATFHTLSAWDGPLGAVNSVHCLILEI
jgi:hypothetical protein